MDNKVLLRVANLKQYFPLKKQWGKEQLFVKANDDISLDIYSGETLGLVGESGCGKSTLGRTLLQLYKQTDGKTMYYGRDIYDVAPKYMQKTFQNIEKVIADLKSSNEKLKAEEAQFETLSEEAKLDKTNQLIAIEEAYKLKVLNVAQLIGGCVVSNDLGKVKTLFLAKYEVAHKIHGIRLQQSKLQVRQNYLESKLAMASEQGKTGSAFSQKIQAITASVQDLENQVTSLKTDLKKADDQIVAYKNSIKTEKDFAYYEELSDDGIDLARLIYPEMRHLRSDLQLIFQDPYSSLNPKMTVGQIIGEGLLAHKDFEQNDPKMQDYIMKVMEECGLSSYMIHRYPHQFSGGQRQRIGIARSLAMKPKFVVCDEAVSALDVSIQSQVINLLQDLKEKEALTYLFISHDLSVVKYISDRIGVMYLGNMVELCSAERIFENPLHPYTEALLKAIPTTDADGRGNITPLEGDIPSPIKPPTGCKFHTRCQYCTEVCTKVTPEWRELEENHFVACHHPLMMENKA